MIVRPFVILIQLYQRFVSPLFGARCRFYPSCSEYTIQALEKHGLIKGAMLSAWRILRCGPWSAGGFDFVP